MKAALDQRGERRHRRGGARAARLDGDLAARRRGQHHQAHDRAAGDPHVEPRDNNMTLHETTTGQRTELIAYRLACELQLELHLDFYFDLEFDCIST